MSTNYWSTMTRAGAPVWMPENNYGCAFFRLELSKQCVALKQNSRQQNKYKELQYDNTAHYNTIEKDFKSFYISSKEKLHIY